MSYVNNNLMSGEKVVLHGKNHWFVFIPSVAVFVFGIFLMGSQEDGIIALGSLFFLAAIIMFFGALMAYLSTELAITSKRVIAKSGLVSRKTVELFHAKVESLTVDQGVFGRIFNFGTLTINGTGGVRTPIKNLANPMQFRRVATEMTEG